MYLSSVVLIFATLISIAKANSQLNLARFSRTKRAANSDDSVAKLSDQELADQRLGFVGFDQAAVDGKSMRNTHQRPVYTCSGQPRPLRITTSPSSIISHDGYGSPNNFYPSNQNCSWLIEAPQGHVIKLSFESFSIEHDPECGYDYVNLYDGRQMTTDLLSEILCGEDGRSFTSSDNTMIIHFVSDWFVTGPGFKANIHFEVPQNPQAHCGSRLTMLSGVITSHAGFGSANLYPNSFQCTWTISVPSHTQIRVVFESFELESHAQCEYDYLRVYDGEDSRSPLIGNFCGNEAPRPILSSSNSLFFLFRTDDGIRMHGFKFSWQPYTGHQLQPASQCGGLQELTQPGSITSPNYGNGNYPNDLSCEWLIRAPPGHVVRVLFNYFELEAISTCIYDYIQLFDGSDSSAPSPGRYCGTNTPEPRVSTWNVMLIIFHTDSVGQHTGFYLTFDFLTSNLPIPGGIQPSIPGGNYGNNGNIGTGQAPNSFVLTEQQQCAGISSPTDSGCGSQRILLGSSGYIKTLNFDTDSTYPSSLQCCWVLNAPVDYAVVLNFEVFHVERNNEGPCTFDYLKVFETANFSSVQEHGPFCGNISDYQLRTTSNNVLLSFRSDGFIERRGFRIRYSVVRVGVVPPDNMASYDASLCSEPRHLERLNGSLRSHTSGRPAYPSGIDCIWRLEAPYGKIFVITFNFFQLETGNGVATCAYDYLSIYNGPTDDEQHNIGPYCGHRNDTTLETNSNIVTFRFHTDDSVQDIGFWLTYQARNRQTTQSTESTWVASPISSATCDPDGVYLSQSAGTITSPGYDGHSEYPNNVDCQWYITTQDGKYLKLVFDEFMLEQSNDCNYDHLTIFDGILMPNQVPPRVLGKFCGSNTPEPIVSSGNELTIYFVTDNEQGDRGFKVNYTALDINVNDPCSANGMLLTTPTGTFSSPNFNGQNNYPANQNCRWQIQAPSSHIIRMEFFHFNLEAGRGGQCRYDRVMLRDGTAISGTPIGTYCGDVRPPRISTKGSQLLVQFQSDSTVQRTGFEIYYTIMQPCSPNFFECESGQCIQQQARCNGYKDCDDESDEAGCNVNENTCGVPMYPPRLGSTRIVGGQSAFPNSWPWHVQLTFNGQHYCGGTLIDHWFVLSAAHCFDDGKIEYLSLWSVIAGKHHKYQKDPYEQESGVAEVTIHADYSKRTNQYDIALVRLQSKIQPLISNGTIMTICVPHTQPPDNTPCYATGWGATKGTGDASVLNQVTLPILGGNLCNSLVSASPKMFCAGYAEGGRDTCQGDSGGPLVCRRPDGRWYQQGITSWGIGCANPNSPGVYTKVSEMNDWLISNLNIAQMTRHLY